MTDATNQAAERAGKPARDAETTDEQIWADMERDDKGAEPDDDRDEGTEPKPKAAAEPEPDPEPSADADPEPSKDDDGGDAGDGETPDGTGPEALQAQVERLQHSLDSERGRTAKNRREIDSLRSKIDDAQQNAAQRGDQDDGDLKAQREKLDAAREEYGDVIGPLADVITNLEARVDQLSAQETRDLDRQRERYTVLVQAEQVVFEKEHPDGFETIKKHREVFNGWIDDQPRAIRDAYADNKQAIVDGSQAALLVGLFKQALSDADGGQAPANAETEKLQHKRQLQLAGARSIRSPNRQQASSRPHAESDDDQGHWDYFKRKDAREAARQK